MTMRFLPTLVITAFFAQCAFALSQDEGPSRWIGMKAPDFRLAGTDGRTHSVDSLVAQGPVVIVWFPKAYTGNVDRLLRSVDEAAKSLNSRGIRVIAASCDKPKYLTPYARSLGLSFPILTDPTRTTAIRWGAVGSGREIPQRWAYFVDREGRIASIRIDLDAEAAGQKIIEKARELGWID